MKCYYAEADWAPKPGYVLNERELADKRARQSDFVWKNIRAGLRDIPTPAIKDDEVLIRVGACGICGSDLHLGEMDGENYSVYAGHTRFPVILGHEFSGEVVEVGKAVKKVKVGDLVAAEQCQWCGKCQSCRIGLFNQCENLEEIGLSADGGFAEYAVLNEKFCCDLKEVAELLGDKLATLEAGALVEPTAVSYSGMQINGGGVKPGSHVLVFGTGTIGLSSIALAKAFGAAKVIAVGRNEARNPIAKQVGADYVLSTAELQRQGITAGEAVMEITGGIGAAMIVETAGNSAQTYPEILKCLAAGAKIIQLGVESAPAVINMMPIIQKNARIQGSLGHAGSDIFPSVIRLMASGRIDMRKIVTGRYALDNVAEALDAKNAKKHVKILVSQHY